MGNPDLPNDLFEIAREPNGGTEVAAVSEPEYHYIR
jgi:hypothetical protein